MVEKLGKNIVKRLTFKHRNSREISLLLKHLRCDMNNRKMSKCISDRFDQSILDSTYLSNFLPIWIMAIGDFSDESILNAIIDGGHVNSTDEDITLLYNDYDLNTKRKELIKNWCKDKKWKCIDRIKIVGSESSVVVLFDVKNAYLEDYSRAKEKLIVVTK